MAAAFCFSIVCLSYLVPYGGRVAGICSAYISPLVGSVVRFVLLIFYIGLVQWWDLFCILNLCDIVQLFCILNLCGIVELFCILNLCDIVQLFCILNLCDIVQLFCSMSFVCPHSPSPIQQLVFWARVYALRLHLVVRTGR
jgi:hypothetical protein